MSVSVIDQSSGRVVVDQGIGRAPGFFASLSGVFAGLHRLAVADVRASAATVEPKQGRWSDEPLGGCYL